MNAQLKPREFPLPSSVKVIPGTERAQAAYPYHMQFAKSDDSSSGSTTRCTFPEPMCAFDMVTARGGLLRARRGQHARALPADHARASTIASSTAASTSAATRVTDPAEIARRTDEFQQRAFYYYANWETLYAQWKQKMLKLIEDARALPKPVAAGVRAAGKRARRVAASPRTTICWRPTRRRSRGTSGCGITTSSSCCWATAPT